MAIRPTRSSASRSRSLPRQIVQMRSPSMLARLARGEAIERYETLWIRRDGQVIPVSLTISPIRDPRGAIIGASTIARDITVQKQTEAEEERRRRETEMLADLNAQLYRQAQEELTQRRQAEAHLTASLREKEVLLKEVHHRVKNNMQIVSSLLELQSDVIDDATLLAQFRESQDRIRSMALIHETLYQSQDLARLDLALYIHTLSARLAQSYNVDPQRITVWLQVEPVILDIDQAIPCGLILNELLINAFKYAFPQNRTGEVHVELHADTAQQAGLVVRDNGIGFPDDIDFHHTESLGLQLVVMLTEQLQGTIALERADGPPLH